MLSQLTDPQTLISLLALAALEIVLGIDNIVFIAIMVQRVEARQRPLAYRLGLAAALITRLLLLLTLSWMMKLTEPLITVLGRGISGRDLILILGGGFLIYKSSSEIFNKVEDREASGPDAGEKSNIAWVVVQIMVVDIVFSLDSVITAVGIADHVWVMATAMVLAVMVMMTFAGPVGEFVTRHPSIQILALSFLLLIGVLLLAEGFGQHVSKGYVYFAMGFSLFVELTNMRQRSKRKRALSQEEAQR